MKWQPSEVEMITIHDFISYVEFLNDDIKAENEKIEAMQNKK